MVICAFCGAQPGAARWCGHCNVDRHSSEYAALENADAAIAQCDAHIADAHARREQWLTYRSTARTAVEAAMAAPAAPAGPAAPAAPAVSADAAPVSAQEPAPPGDAVGVAAPPSELTVLRRLTPPALLGIGGAALLIASAIVFVAVSWGTLGTVVQVATIVALAAGVAALAVWLTRIGLPITAGAVGVVAMAFPAVGVVAIERAADALGAFTGAVALVVACLCAAVLRRLSVPWVAEVSALSLGVAGLWAVVAARVEFIEGFAAASFTAAAAALVIGPTHDTWPTRWTRRVIRVSAVTIAAVGVLASVAVVSDASGSAWWTVGAAAAPLLALVGLGRHWARMPWIALGFVLPLWIGAVGVAAGASTAVMAVMALACGVLATAVIAAVASPQTSSALMQGAVVWYVVPLGIVGFGLLDFGASPSTAGWGFDAPWTGVALLLFAAGLRVVLAKVPRRVRTPVGASGAALTVLGVVLACVSAADVMRERWLGGVAPSVETMVACLAALVAAGLMVAAMVVWRLRAARWTLGIGAVATATISGIAGVSTVVMGDVAAGALVAGAAVVVLALGMRLSVPTVAGCLVFLSSATAAAVTGHWLDSWVAGLTVGGVVGLVALAVAVPTRKPTFVSVASGATPAVLASAFGGLVLASVAVERVVSPDSFLSTSVADWPASTFVFASLMVATAGLVEFVVGRAAAIRPWAHALRRRAGYPVTLAMAVVPLAGAIAVSVPVDSREIVLVAAVALSIASWAALAVARTAAARRGVWIAGTVLITGSAVLVLRDAANANAAWPVAAALVVVAMGALAVAAMWVSRVTVGPLAFLLTGLVGAIAWAVGAPVETVGVSVALATACLSWARLAVTPALRLPLLCGLAPGYAVTGAVAVAAGVAGLERVIQVAPAGPAWIAVGALAAGLTVWSVPVSAGVRSAVTSASVLLASVALPVPAAWIVVLVTAATSVVVLTMLRVAPAAAGVSRGASSYSRAWGLALALASGIWAFDSLVAWASILGVTGSLAVAVALTTARQGKAGLLAAGAVVSGIAAGFAVVAGGAPSEAASVLAATVAAALVLPPIFRRVDPGASAAVAVVAGVTVAAPASAGSLWGAGVTLLVAAAAWWALRLAGVRAATWFALSALVAGEVGIFADLGVTVVEAYSAIPAAIAITMGVLHLLKNPGTPSLHALWPGLALVLGPSLVALVVDPVHMGRVLWLTFAVAVLAAVGVAMAWRAPIAAAAITAVGLALTQAAASDGLVPRWLAFAAVGAVMIALAATYEKVKKLR